MKVTALKIFLLAGSSSPRRTASYAGIALFAGIGLALATSQAQASLVAGWHFDEGTGQSVADASSNGYTGTFLLDTANPGNGQPATWAAGSTGNSGDYAANFNNIGPLWDVKQHLNVTDTTDFGLTSQLTLFFRLKPNQPLNGAGSSEQLLAGKFNGGTDGSFYVGQRLGTSSRGLQFSLVNSGDTRVDINTAGNGAVSQITDYNDGNWHYAAATYDGSTMKLYWDGALVASASQTGNIKVTSWNFEVGHFAAVNGDAAWGYNGLIDDVGIWNTAMTADDIANLDATYGVPEPATLALLGLGGLCLMGRQRGRELFSRRVA